MKVPTHVAFIMDGNRRWAKKKGLPITAGHTKGFKRIEPLVEYAADLGIKVVTFYTFSTENWNRDKREVSFLLQIFRRLFKSSLIKKLKAKKAKVIVLGELDPFPEDIKEEVKQVVEETHKNNGIIVNLALNYGGRPELLRAINALLKVAPKKPVDEATFSQQLYTEGQPDPDLVIRTSGEMRLSGFLTWQSVYSELYFTDVYWPDFDAKQFQKALDEYAARERRYGK